MVVGDVTTAVDVLVLGAGPGGYVAAIRAAQLGHHVTLVDPGAGAPSVPGAPGGTCLHRGCIPLKALLSSSERYAQARQEDMGAMGIHVESISLNWPVMQDWKQGVVNRLSDGVRKLLSGNRIEYVTGTGWFINDQEMRVEGEYGSHHFKFDHCILAVGAESAPLPGLPYNGKQVLTPEQALMLPALPEALSIYGDDYIALELATVFARLGVTVKLYAPGEHILAGVDPAALRLVQAGLRKLGITVTTKVTSENIAERPIVISNGVCPHTAGLHLHDAGVEVMANGGIAVNTMQQSNVPHIYAVGDCAGGSGGQAARVLASVAIKQGKVAAEVLSGQRVQFAPLVVPQVVHTTPELATVGYTAEAATRAGYTVASGRFPLAANGRAQTLGADAGVALIVASADDGVLLGATLVGLRAGDLIGQLSLAIEMGATLTDLSEILYPHPSLSETLQEGVENALGRAIHILTKG